MVLTSSSCNLGIDNSIANKYQSFFIIYRYHPRRTLPTKIKTFVFLDESTSSKMFASIQLLIQKIGDYIENLSIYMDKFRGKLFDAVIDFCKKIKFLHLKYIDSINIS